MGEGIGVGAERWERVLNMSLGGWSGDRGRSGIWGMEG